MSRNLTSMRSLPCSGPNRVAAGCLSGGSITSHNAHYVTIEPRRSCNMSYGNGLRTSWHACCLYHTIEGPTGGPEGSKARRIRRKHGPDQARDCALPALCPRKKKNDTPPHKQATDRPTPPPAGFFLLAQIARAILCSASPVATPDLAGQGRPWPA